MNARCLLSLTSVVVSVVAMLSWQDASAPTTKPAQVADDSAVESNAEPRLADLSFLAGEWSGTNGSSTWLTWYSTPEGGQILGASKELRGGRVVMIDFEQFFVHEGTVHMTPYPFGNRSVSFALTELSRKDKRVVFANEEHDFPKRFTYRRAADDRLEITLEGDMGEGPMQVDIVLKPAAR